VSKDRVSKQVRQACAERDGGWCVRVHVDGRKRSRELHHRRTAAMGGSSLPGTNTPANLVSLCSPCHLLVTVYPDRGRKEGLVLLQGSDPASSPVLWRGRWVLLGKDGSTTPSKEVA
jgi:5-methylcytosine-specific restriction protein A